MWNAARYVSPRLLGVGVASAALACGSRTEPKKDVTPSAAASSTASQTGDQAAMAPIDASASSPKPMPSAGHHVDVTAGASTREGPTEPVQASGEIDGALLMKRHRDRIHGDHSPVTVLAGEGPLDLGRRICEAVVPQRPPTTPVLLKPNMCGFDGMKDPAGHNGDKGAGDKGAGDNGVKGRTTDPEFVRGVIRCLKPRGYQHLTVAESCGFAADKFEQLARISGYRAMVDEEGVPLVAMDDDGKYDVEGADFKPSLHSVSTRRQAPRSEPSIVSSLGHVGSKGSSAAPEELMVRLLPRSHAAPRLAHEPDRGHQLVAGCLESAALGGMGTIHLAGNIAKLGASLRVDDPKIPITARDIAFTPRRDMIGVECTDQLGHALRFVPM